MYNLTAKGQKWLKFVHLTFVCLWVGTAIALNAMLIFLKAQDGMQLYGINTAIKFVDDFVLIPGAMGTLLTGILYAVFTRWGWFKHHWITVKWVITIYGILFGTFFLGPWTNELVPIAKTEGLSALTNPEYVQNKSMLLYWGLFQVFTLVFAVVISVLKPWKKGVPRSQN